MTLALGGDHDDAATARLARLAGLDGAGHRNGGGLCVFAVEGSVDVGHRRDVLGGEPVGQLGLQRRSEPGDDGGRVDGHARVLGERGERGGATLSGDGESEVQVEANGDHGPQGTYGLGTACPRPPGSGDATGSEWEGAESARNLDL